MAKSKLKNCPFCGGDLCVSFTTEDPPNHHSIGCLQKSCRAFGPIRRTVEQAIASWNRRKVAGDYETGVAVGRADVLKKIPMEDAVRLGLITPIDLSKYRRAKEKP